MKQQISQVLIILVLGDMMTLYIIMFRKLQTKKYM